jgi:hypothetical protein
MKNGEDRGKDGLVKKSMKTTAARVEQAAVRQGGDCGTEADAIGLNGFDDAIVSLCRSGKVLHRAEVADQIGVGLRSVYDDVLSQPVPDRFFDLLRQLERAPQLKKDAP